MKTLLRLLLLCLIVSSCKKEINGDTIITNINVIDVIEEKVLPAQDLIIIGNQIISIQNHNSNQKYIAQNVINGSGKYVIPGLMDMHTHVLWKEEDFRIQNKMMIANGVTAFREMWGVDSIAQFAKQNMKTGALVPQRIYFTNHMLDGPPEIWDGSGEVNNAEEAIRFVDSIVQQTDAEFIKVYSLLSRESFMAIANRCKELNIDFAGHIPDYVPLEDAISTGMRSTEHLYGFKIALSDEREYYFNNPNQGTGEDYLKVCMSQSNKRIDTVAKVLVNNNSMVVPTLIMLLALDKANRDASLVIPEYNEFVPEYRRLKWDNPDKYPAKYDSLNIEMIKRDFEIVRLLNERDVKIVAGTDTDFVNAYTFAGFSLQDELYYLVKAGLSPGEALQAATIHAAELMNKKDSLGQVKQGFLADLVLLNGNPLQQIEHTRAIDGVFSNGVFYNRESLNKLLQEAKELVDKLELEYNKNIQN